ncbi:MAG: hypothetical protein JXA90_06295, partial [Planctomycetes bacterium]|nr:hypothetical protein [Planctomycetota bacterium]
GDATELADAVPGPGIYAYEVIGTLDGIDSASAACGPIEVTYVPAVTDIACTANEGSTVTVTWVNGSSAYSSIALLLDGAAVPESPLDSAAEAYTSAPLGPGAHVFTVRPSIGAYDAPGAICSVGIDVMPPSALSCIAALDSYEVSLSWSNGQTYESVTVLRDGSEPTVLEGSPAAHIDTVPGPGVYSYAVFGTVNAIESASASCGPANVSYVPPLVSLDCAVDTGDDSATLTWVNGSAAYTSIAVLLDGAPAAGSPLGGGETTYTSTALSPGAHSFVVQPSIGSYVASETSCGVSVVVQPPADLACEAVAGSFTVELSWTNARTYDSVTILRNGAPLESIEGSAAAYTDVVPGPGSYAYAVLGTIGLVSSAQAVCGPVEVSYVPAVIDLVCTAVADDAVALTWTNGSSAYTNIAVLIDGEQAPETPLAGSTTTYTTAPLAAGLHTFAVRGLIDAWPSADAECAVLVAVDAPADLACAEVAGELAVLLTWTPAGPYESITVKRDGAVAGVIAGDATEHKDTVPAAGSYSYEVFGTVGGVDAPSASCGPVAVAGGELLAPVESLQCALAMVLRVSLRWVNPVEYDSIEVKLDGETAGSYAGTAVRASIAIPDLGTYTLEVIGKKAGFLNSPPATCIVESQLRPFIRADSNSDGGADISDAVYSLNYLFRGRQEPSCLAAADANGDNDIDISDAIWTLTFLFMGGQQPPPPYPECGVGEAPLTAPSCNEYSWCESP